MSFSKQVGALPLLACYTPLSVLSRSVAARPGATASKVIERDKETTTMHQRRIIIEMISHIAVDFDRFCGINLLMDNVKNIYPLAY